MLYLDNTAQEVTLTHLSLLSIPLSLSLPPHLSIPLSFLLSPFSPLPNGETPSRSPLFWTSQSLFQPLDSDVSLAKKCVNQGCGLHLFAFCQQDVGGAWPGHVPYMTGGAFRSYDSLLVSLVSLHFLESFNFL